MSFPSQQKGVSPSDVSDDGDVAKGKKSKKDKKRLLTVKILRQGSFAILTQTEIFFELQALSE